MSQTALDKMMDRILRERRVMKHLNLTIEAIKNLKQVGTIVSSSRFLRRKIIGQIDFSDDMKVLELGAGNGVITRELLEEMPNGSSEMYVYEKNERLLKYVEQINDHRLVLKGESVANLNELNKDGYFDVVVSSLPLANFPSAFKNRIYKAIEQKLKPGGVFIQYQYSLFDYKNIESFFGNCSLDFCLLNMPPAFIYKARLN